MTFARVEDIRSPAHFELEVSPFGTADVYLDDRLAAIIPSPRLAVIGNGVIIPIDWEPGLHRIAVRTCPSESHVGFYAWRGQ